MKYPRIFLISIISMMCLYIYNKFIFDDFLFVYLDLGVDSYHETVALLGLIHDYLRSDGFPFWTFNIGLGQNIWGLYITDPFHWPLLLLASKEQIAYFLVYIQILKILSIALIFFQYLKTLKVNNYSAALAALLCAFSAPVILRSQWPFFINMPIYFALMLWSFELFYIKKKNWPLPCTMFLVAINDTFIFILFSFILFLYAIFRYFVEKDTVNIGSIKKFTFFLFDLSKLYLCGILLSGLIFLPQFYSLLTSPRVSGDQSFINHLTNFPIYSLAGPLEIYTSLLRFFSNDILGGGGISYYKGWANYMESPAFYSGILVLLIAPQFLAFGTKRERFIHTLIIIPCVLYIISPYFRFMSNLFAGTYYRYSMWINFTLLYLSTISLNHIIEKKYISKKILFLSVLAILLFLILAYLQRPFPADAIIHKTYYLVIFYIISYVSLLYFFHANNKVKYLIFLLAIIELTTFSYKTVNKNRHLLHKNEYISKNRSYLDHTNEALAYLHSIDKSFYRVEKNFNSVFLNDSLFQNYKGTRAYFSFNQDSYLAFRAAMGEDNGPSGVVLDSFKDFNLNNLVGVKYYLIKDKLEAKNRGNHDYSIFYEYNDYKEKGPLEHIKDISNIHIYENKNAMPIAFTYPLSNSILEKDFFSVPIKERSSLLNNFYIKGKNIKTASNNISNITAKKISHKSRDEFNILYFDHNHIKGKITIKETNKMLFFSIPYDLGWKIKVGNKIVPTEKINLGFIGVALPVGEHQIELSFRPYLFYWGLVLSLIGCASLLMYVWGWNFTFYSLFAFFSKY
ncbi:MAG: YfhO family protein [Oligoflexia bacterium]|nr:YfhO family protein [Oligoflexia bacterium]